MTICDEYVEPIDFDTDADFVGITGKVIQGERMIASPTTSGSAARRCIIGGPYASLSPDAVRAHCDVLVIGELEAIAGELFADLERGDWKSEYAGRQAGSRDLAAAALRSLPQRSRARRAASRPPAAAPSSASSATSSSTWAASSATSRVEQILAELDVLYDIGYRAVFLADDNFTVYRKRAKAMLAAIRDWNASRPDGPVAFHTQVSIDAARDPEIMRLCGEAGLTRVFIGIETPNEESLRETRKRQNVGIDLVEQVQVFLDHGISVTGGMIVGFDHDGPDIFERQYDFAMATPIPIFTLGALVAPAATPLYDRMKESGRLVADGHETIGVWNTNIQPTLMSREQLFAGLKWLGNRLYHPANFARRVVAMIERMGPQLGPFKTGLPAAHAAAGGDRGPGVIRKLISSGPEERAMCKTIFEAMSANPETGPMVMMSLFSYAQVRCLYDTGSVWEPHVASGGPALGPPKTAAGSGLVTLGTGAAGS